MDSIAILDVDIGGRCPACGDSDYAHGATGCSAPLSMERRAEDGKRCGCRGPTAKQRAEHRDKMMEVGAGGIQRLYHSNWPHEGGS